MPAIVIFFQNALAAVATIMPSNARSIAIQDITKNIQLFTEEPRNVDKDARTLRYVKIGFLKIIYICTSKMYSHRPDYFDDLLLIRDT